MTIKYIRQWLWECNCGANGYENTKEEAKESAWWHKQNCMGITGKSQGK